MEDKPLARTLLLVNRDESALCARTKLLTREGYRVLQADSEPTALAMAAAHLPDLVLVDVNVPLQEQSALCGRLRKQTAPHPLKILHLFATPEIRPIVPSAIQADAVLVEPIQDSDLLNTVQTLLLKQVRETVESEPFRALETEQALRDSERRYRELFDSIDQGLCTIEVLFDAGDYPIDYRFLMVNPAFERQTGITNAVGRRMREIAPLHEEQWFQIYGEIALSGTARRFEHHAGQLGRYYEVYAWRVGAPEERKVAVLLNDVTERNAAETALLESEDRFRTLADHMSQLAWMAEREGSVIWYNRRWYEYTGTSFDEMQGWGWELVHHPDHLSRVVEKWKEALASGKPWEDTFPLLGKDGRYRWFLSRALPIRDQQGAIVRWFGTNTDVTELREAEEGLRESEQRLRAALVAGQMGAWDIDLATGHVTWDAKQAEIFGRPMQAPPATAEDFYALIHPDDVVRVRHAAAACLLTDSFSEIFRIIRGDGAVRWLVGQGTVVRDPAGHAIRIVGVNKDITDRKLADEELRRWKDELEVRVKERTKALVDSEERLRALTMELNLAEQRERHRLAIELHDHLQQLLVLGKIKIGQSKPLASAVPGCAEAMRQVDEILSAALAYTRTLVSELSPPVLREHGLAAGLRWLVEYMRRHDLTVTLTLPHEDQLKLPEQQSVLLFQSVRELLINASKHAGTGLAWVTVRRDAGELLIDVMDQGPGFDSPSSASPGATSSELSSKFGLYSIQERMKALGGRLVIDSCPERGTTATLALRCKEADVQNEPSAPRGAEPMLVSSSGPSAHPAAHDARIRVLLADDHAMVRQGLRAILERHADIEIVGEAANGLEALDLTDRFRPEIVVMDINMPEMNGIEATARLKARYPGLYVLGLSVNAGRENQYEMSRAGAQALLTKEAAGDQLYGLIQELAVRKSGEAPKVQGLPHHH
jgi:PAS domain S-box-containing protein